MNTHLDCIPCFFRQALEAVRFVTGDPVVHERLLRELLREASEMDLSKCPPAIGQELHRRLRQLSGVADPYHKARTSSNTLALKMLPDLATEVESSADPLSHALRLAIAGNVIDLSVKSSFGQGEIREAVQNMLNERFEGDVEDFRASIEEAASILYLADNAGEIVFDRLLIEQLPPGRVAVAVRGAPVLNDAIREDAESAGLCGLVEVFDNGSDAPGTILADCSEDFRQRFDSADLVIAKGQGNFETLTDVRKNIYFLFKTNCPVIASHVGLPVGTHVAIPSRPLSGPAEGW